MKRKNTPQKYNPSLVVDMICLLQTMRIMAKQFMKMLIALDDSMNAETESDRSDD